jgi:hypothetical protein
MIGDALRAEIEAYAASVRTTSPLFTRAATGAITPVHVARYLANVHQLVLHTPIHLRRAEAAARALGDEALARHYRTKRGEEVGHDAWAERDLARIAPRLPSAPPRDLVPAMQELLAYLEGCIDESPAQYLAYILFAEHTMVLLGPGWLELLETHCGIPRSSMTIVANHVELDGEHVEDALAHIDALVPDPLALPRLRAVLHRAMHLFDQFCEQVTTYDYAAAPAA